MSGTAKPLDAWVARVFVRQEGSCRAALPAGDDLDQLARANPGTLRIEDMDGHVMWPEWSTR